MNGERQPQPLSHGFSVATVLPASAHLDNSTLKLMQVVEPYFSSRVEEFLEKESEDRALSRLRSLWQASCLYFATSCERVSGQTSGYLKVSRVCNAFEISPMAFFKEYCVILNLPVLGKNFNSLDTHRQHCQLHAKCLFNITLLYSKHRKTFDCLQNPNDSGLKVIAHSQAQELCWMIFVFVKQRLTEPGDADLAVSIHIYVCCLNFVLVHANTVEIDSAVFPWSDYEHYTARTPSGGADTLASLARLLKISDKLETIRRTAQEVSARVRELLAPISCIRTDPESTSGESSLHEFSTPIFTGLFESAESLTAATAALNSGYEADYSTSSVEVDEREIRHLESPGRPANAPSTAAAPLSSHPRPPLTPTKLARGLGAVYSPVVGGRRPKQVYTPSGTYRPLRHDLIHSPARYIGPWHSRFGQPGTPMSMIAPSPLSSHQQAFSNWIKALCDPQKPYPSETLKGYLAELTPSPEGSAAPARTFSWEKLDQQIRCTAGELFSNKVQGLQLPGSPSAVPDFTPALGALASGNPPRHPPSALVAESISMKASQAVMLFYTILETTLTADRPRLPREHFLSLLEQLVRARHTIFALAAEVVAVINSDATMEFPVIPRRLAVDFLSISEVITTFHTSLLAASPHTPDVVRAHLNRIDCKIVEHLAWEPSSDIYYHLAKARPPNASIIAAPSTSEELGEGHPAPSSPPPTRSRADSASKLNLLSPDHRSAFRPLASPSRSGAGPRFGEGGAVMHRPQKFGMPGVVWPGARAASERLIAEFLKKLMKLAHKVVHKLFDVIQDALKNNDPAAIEQCSKFKLPDQTLAVIQRCVYEQTHLLYNRHMHHLVMCAAVGVLKSNSLAITFKRMLEYYKRIPDIAVCEYTAVVLDQSEDLTESKHGDLIKFYNECFVPLMKQQLQEVKAQFMAAAEDGALEAPAPAPEPSDPPQPAAPAPAPAPFALSGNAIPSMQVLDGVLKQRGSGLHSQDDDSLPPNKRARSMGQA